MTSRTCVTFFAVAAMAVFNMAQGGEGKTLKVYLLVGQSNMQGMAKLKTIPSMAYDPKSKALHDKIVDKTGKPRVHKNASIVYFSGGGGRRGVPRTQSQKQGLLTTGFGWDIGPELAFGITMDERIQDPILIIKIAWGGRSLNFDFRPPSAGTKPLTGRERKGFEKYEVLEVRATKIKEYLERRKPDEGYYYRAMIKHVKTVLADPGKYSSAYDPKKGFEIAGFVWFQGFNDAIDTNTYPRKGKPDRFKPYSELLTHFIKDVRKDLDAPKMPFVIGAMGLGGHKNKGAIPFRNAMAAPAALPEFKGTVAAVQTADFWDYELQPAIDQMKRSQKRFNGTYYYGKDGALSKSKVIKPGWSPIGTPEFEKRQWHYTTFERKPEEDYRKRKEGEKAPHEIVFVDDVPAPLTGWYKPDFDASKWKQGLAPIGKGKWGSIKPNAEWGDGNVILMRTTFELDTIDCVKHKLAILCKGSYAVYLNGHKIRSYPWYNKKTEYRSVSLSNEAIGHLKKGTNVLAAMANLNIDRQGKGANSMDLMIWGITKENLEAQEKIRKSLCPPEIKRIAEGASNQGYHYMGSAKIYSRIGEAFAKALLEMTAK